MRLQNKVAVITGGGLGIGRGTALRLAEEGAKVIVAARNEKNLQETVRQIKEKGGEASYILVDISKEDSVKNMFAETEKIYGGIDILFNNAAVFTGMHQKIEDVKLEEWNDEISVNLTGYFLCCKYVIPYMRKRGGGSIISTSSISAFIGQKDFGPYSVTKGGLEPMTKCIAVDYGPENIRANTVCPAYVLTEQSEKDQAAVGEAKLKELHPIGRVGYPRDVANAVLFLASDESSWITGSALIVDGGYLAQ